MNMYIFDINIQFYSFLIVGITRLTGQHQVSLSIHGDFWRQNKRIHNFE